MSRRRLRGRRISLAIGIPLLLLGVSGCDSIEEQIRLRLAAEPFYQVPGRIYELAAEGWEAESPPGPAPASEVDPHEPWSALGDLSGYYRLTAERLQSDCTRGPDIPFIAGDPSLYYEEPELQLWDDSFDGYLTQRGDTISLEVGDGLLFATWNSQTNRLEDAERVGPEGVTAYLDGFDVESVEENVGHDLLIRGESDWVFEDEHYVPGERCQGRTRWEAKRLLTKPWEHYRDLQVVLRWPAESSADLDLQVGAPGPLNPIRREDERADFARARRSCYSLRSVGPAPDPGGFVADFAATRLPYHEEIIRCSGAPYGAWGLTVVNWSSDESVDYQIEVFSGAGVNTGKSGERSFGAIGWWIDPLSVEDHPFVLTPPSSPGNPAGSNIISTRFRPYPVARPSGALTGTYLEFDKAAWEGVRYEDFIGALDH